MKNVLAQICLKIIILWMGGEEIMIICILGPPGAGKTTQVKELIKSNELSKVIDLSVPKLCKYEQNELNEFLIEEEKQAVDQNLAKVNENREKGQLFPVELDRILLEIAIRLSHAGINIILEGYPRGIEQAKIFIEKVNSNHLRDSLKLICLNFNDHELESIKKRQFERAVSD